MILIEQFFRKDLTFYTHHVSLNLIFNVNTHNGILLFSQTFPVTCRGHIKKPKVASRFIYNSERLYIIIYSITREKWF